MARALTSWILLSMAIVLPMSAQEEEGMVDFSDRVRERCDLVALYAPPPPGWFTMQVEDLPEGLSGCMMMLLDENNEDVGILHLLSASRSVEGFSGPDLAAIAALEMQYVAAMGYETGGLLWKRESVPVAGPGFEPGRGLGVSASHPDDSLAQELHLLSFQSTDVQYIIALLTPSKDEAPELYKRNTDDFGVLIRSFQFSQP